MGLFAGLISMLGWGVADFFAAKLSRSIGVLKTLLFTQLVGFLVISGFFAAFGKLPETEIGEIAIALLLSFIYFIGFLAFYRSLEIGPIYIVSPISASSGMVAVALSILFFREILSLKQAMGIILVILGVIFSLTNLREVFGKKIKIFSKGIIFAFLTMLSWGIFYAFLAFLVDRWGWLFTALIVRSFFLLILIFYLSFFAEDFLFRLKSNIILLVLGTGFFEVVGALSYNIGIQKELTTIVAPVSSAFPVVTIFLASIFLKEKLISHQYFGIGLITFGLILLNF